MQGICLACSRYVRELTTQAVPSVSRRRYPLPVRLPPNPALIKARTEPPNNSIRGALSRLDEVSAGVARELFEITSPKDALSHHKQNMEDYDLVACSTALGKVVGGGRRMASTNRCTC